MDESKVLKILKYRNLIKNVLSLLIFFTFPVVCNYGIKTASPQEIRAAGVPIELLLMWSILMGMFWFEVFRKGFDPTWDRLFRHYYLKDLELNYPAEFNKIKADEARLREEKIKADQMEIERKAEEKRVREEKRKKEDLESKIRKYLKITDS